MQLFSTILAAAASVFMMVSAEDHANPKSRSSRPVASRSSRSSRPSLIGGDSAVWGPSSGCDSSSSYPSPCSSSWSSECSSLSSSSSCNKPCRLPCETTLCNPFARGAVVPLCPLTECEPVFGPNYGPYPGPGCANNGCAPCFNNGCAPFVDNECSPCGPRPLARRRGHVQPWYVYLTATYTSTYASTTTALTSTTVTETTVSYTIFTLTAAPTTYYGPATA